MILTFPDTMRFRVTFEPNECDNEEWKNDLETTVFFLTPNDLSVCHWRLIYSCGGKLFLPIVL